MKELQGAKTKLSRAIDLWNELTQLMHDWISSGGIKLHLEAHPVLAQYVWYIYKTSEPARSVEAVSGDILDNLRNALDYIAWQIFIQGGGSAADKAARNVYFPVVDDEAGWQKALRQKVPTAWPGAVQALRECQPFAQPEVYKMALPVLQGMNSGDKHRQLSLVAVANMSLKGITPELSDDQGMSFAITRPGPTLELNIGNEIGRIFVFRANSTPPTDFSEVVPRDQIRGLSTPPEPDYSLNLRNGDWEIDMMAIKDLIMHVKSIVEKFESLPGIEAPAI